MKWLDKLVSWVLKRVPTGTASIKEELDKMDAEEEHARVFLKELEKIVESKKRKNVN